MFSGKSKNFGIGDLRRKKLKEINNSLRKGIIPLEITHQLLLRELKYDLSEKEVDVILDKLDEDTFEKIIFNPLCDNYSDLSKPELYLNGSNLKKETDWVLRFLIDYSDEINDFLKHEQEYERFLLLGQYENALNIVNKIDREITVSTWSIQQRLFIAELDKGFAANKDVLAFILSDENSQLVNFIASYTSIRIEKNISPGQYTTFVNEYVNAIKDPELNKYVYFKVDFLRNFEYQNYSQILVYDGTLSIIDRYKTFKQFAQIVLCDFKSGDAIKYQLISAAKRLRSVIKDLDLELISALSDGRVDDIDIDFVQLLDTYTDEHYEEAVTLSEAYLLKNPSCIQAIYIYTRSLCNTNKEPKRFNEAECLLDRIVSLVYSIYRKGTDFTQEKYIDLYKIAHFLGAHPLAVGILEFLSTEVVHRLNQAYEIDLHKLSVLNSKAVNPSLFSHIDLNSQEAYLHCIDSKKESSTILLIRKLGRVDKKTVLNKNDYSFRELKYFSIKYRRLNKPLEALELLDFILESDKFTTHTELNHIAVELAFEKYNCLINLERFQEAIGLANEWLIKNENLLPIFYNPVLISKLTDTIDASIQADINLPIFLKFYESDIDLYNIYVAFDNFLCAKACDTPKDFFKHFNNKNAMHIAFLDKVAKHEILHSSPYFKDQEELDLARIEICTFLNQNVPGSDHLETEISDLLRKVLVRKGIKQIDYSKIYVDVKGLKTIISKELKESFTRNIEIASLPVDQLNKIVDSVGNILVYYVENADPERQEVENDDIINNVKITSYNRFVHFSEAFLKIRDKFLMSSDHGLDTYLSMRIRHGTLPGQIRSVFESYKLITAWNDNERKYLPNEYWLNQVNYLGEEKKNVLNAAFDKFSKGIDDISERLKSQIIQIKTETDTKNHLGLFDYSYSNEQLLDLFSLKFGSIRNFDDFVSSTLR